MATVGMMTEKLPTIFVSGSGLYLVGCHWIEELTVDIQPVHKVAEFPPTEACCCPDMKMVSRMSWEPLKELKQLLM